MTDKHISANMRRRCQEIMTRKVTTAAREMTLQEAAALLRDGDIGSLPVTENKKLVGILTDRDIVIRAVAEGKNFSAKVGDIMTTEVFSAQANDFVFEAIRLMGEKKIRRIPVVNEADDLIGIIAMADVALETEDEREIAAALEEISSGSAFWKK